MKIQSSNAWLEDRHKRHPKKEQKPKGKSFDKHLKEAMGVSLYEKFRIETDKKGGQ